MSCSIARGWAVLLVSAGLAAPLLADEPAMPQYAIEAAPAPSPQGVGPEGFAPEGFAPQGGMPQLAPHFIWPTRSYSLFRSPVSYGMEGYERCPSSPYTPRGYGVPRRTSCDRMDYRPYVLKSAQSAHGPAFYARHYLQPCCDPYWRECQRHFEETSAY